MPGYDAKSISKILAKNQLWFEREPVTVGAPIADSYLPGQPELGTAVLARGLKNLVAESSTITQVHIHYITIIPSCRLGSSVASYSVDTYFESYFLPGVILIFWLSYLDIIC